LIHIDVEMGSVEREELSAIHDVWGEFFPRRAIQRGRGFRVQIGQSFSTFI
jgi:hypothetical protein